MAAVDLFVQRVITDDRWMNDAACRGLTHLFFPLPAERPQARASRSRRSRRVRQLPGERHLPSLRPHQPRVRLLGGESEDERHAAGFRLIAPIGVRARNVI